MQVDVVVRGDQEAVRLISRLAARMEDGRPQFIGLVDELTGAQRERFAGRGQRWRRLADSTLRRHRMEGAPARPLILTGELMRSLTVPGHPEQRVVFQRDRMQFGTRVWYAQFHQRGIGVPKRAVVGLSRAQKKTVVDELRRLLVQDL